MARYDYKCSVCAHIQEVSHGMCESPEIVCGSCGQKSMSKMISKSLNFILKGASWSGKNAKEKGI